jgi:hypothetical protein
MYVNTARIPPPGASSTGKDATTYSAGACEAALAVPVVAVVKAASASALAPATAQAPSTRRATLIGA